MRGRRPKPTHLHRLQGTYHTGKHGRDRANEPRPESDLHAAPAGLTPRQRASWQYAIKHSPARLLKRLDRGVLMVWVEAEGRHRTAMEMQATLDRNASMKLLIEGPRGFVLSPYHQILKETAGIMIRAAQELGFSPAARPRVAVEPEASSEDEADPWVALRLVPGGRTEE
jgi:P27 family predicted phage terminase small subunit